MRSLAILFAAAGLLLACERAQQTADTAVDDAQTYSEAADELAADVAADVSAGPEDPADAAKRETQKALDAVE